MRARHAFLPLLLAFGPAAPPGAAAPPSEGAAGGVRWTVPARWQEAPTRPMRVATYVLPAPPGAEAGECGVFFFGKGQGGSVDDNLARWAAQFEAASAPKKTVKTINGLKVHEIDLTGTYLSPGGPMMQSQGKKPGWRLLGAIVEAPDGLVFFKCTGPAATIQKAEKELDALLQSLTKAARAGSGLKSSDFQPAKLRRI